MDFFSAPIPEDFSLLKSVLGKKFHAEYVQINYGSVERTCRLGPSILTGENILVGNSATPTNNHAEIFKMLAKLDLANRIAIVPLNYGAPASYRDAIIKLGERILGKHFMPLIDFMSLVDYNKLVSSCSVAIMNHRRQQALGNIGTALYKGAKVFLDETNVVYQSFINRGAHVFSTRLLLEGGATIFNPLSKEQILDNQRVLEEFWGHDVVIANAKEFIRRLEERRLSHA